jgi:hypothetical protein
VHKRNQPLELLFRLGLNTTPNPVPSELFSSKKSTDRIAYFATLRRGVGGSDLGRIHTGKHKRPRMMVLIILCATALGRIKACLR